MRNRIGECLIQAGHIAQDDLRAALAEHKRTGERVGIVLARLNLATEEQVAKALASQLGFPYVDLAERTPDPAAVVLIPKEVAAARGCVAVSVENGLLTVAMSDPLLFSVIQDLERHTRHRIRPVVATRAAIVRAIEVSYPDSAPAIVPPQSAAAVRSDDAVAATADLVDRLLKSAVTSGATDVHVEPTENGVVVRHRFDGRLKQVMALPMSAHHELVAHLKTMAGMDAGETRLPQGGRFRSTTADGSEIDFRVSTLRTLFGEKVVMRVVDRLQTAPSLDAIGMSATALERVRGVLGHERGMLLVVGPAASGKTTTLGSLTRAVQTDTTNIVTIEDPIEYRIPGVNQTQVDDQRGLTVTSALASVLQQDAEVIVLDDVRDGETAALAIQAAQNGRLVLSTLNADDVPSAMGRLVDLGGEPSAVASALVGVVAQRLVRRLCVRCRRPYTPSADMLRALNVADADADADSAANTFYEATGCDECNHTGFRGRIGIFEVMRVTDRLRRLIAARAAGDALRAAAIDGGMTTLGEDGLAKVKSGVTTADELLRVATEFREMRTLCPGCGSAVGVDFNACPHCGKRLGGNCPHCGRSRQPGWNYCPYCARGTSEVRGPAKRPRDPAEGDEPRERPPSNVAEFKK